MRIAMTSRACVLQGTHPAQITHNLHLSPSYLLLILVPCSHCPDRERLGGVMLRLAAALVGFLVTLPAFSQQSASAQPSEAPSPRLVVHARGIAGESLPLGLTIEGTGDGAVVIVTGLVPGMSLSTGTALGANVWQVPATDIANTT